jgi:HEAT repeat protein
MCVSCALTKIAPDKYPAEELVATLIEQLTEEDPEVRWGAVLILAELGPAARRAIPALVTAHDDRQFLPRHISWGGISDPRNVGDKNPVLWAMEKIDPEKAKEVGGK